MRLNRIGIDACKSIKRVQLELRPLNLLIGENGAGKSNFLALFGILNPAYRNTTFGVQIPQRVGLPRMRQTYPHFDEWLKDLEFLADRART